MKRILKAIFSLFVIPVFFTGCSCKEAVRSKPLTIASCIQDIKDFDNGIMIFSSQEVEVFKLNFSYGAVSLDMPKFSAIYSVSTLYLNIPTISDYWFYMDFPNEYIEYTYKLPAMLLDSFNIFSESYESDSETLTICVNDKNIYSVICKLKEYTEEYGCNFETINDEINDIILKAGLNISDDFISEYSKNIPELQDMSRAEIEKYFLDNNISFNITFKTMDTGYLVETELKMNETTNIFEMNFAYENEINIEIPSAAIDFIKLMDLYEN